MKALTRDSALAARALYAETDERGKRKWSIAQIADHLGIGETTAYRAIKGLGPYAYLKADVGRTPEEISREAAESLARLDQLLRGEAPPSPLDNGEPPDSGRGSIVERLNKEIQARDAGKMLEELRGESND